MHHRRFLAAVAVLTLLLVALALWAIPSTTDFSISNSSWNGLREAARQLGWARIASLDRIPPQVVGTAIIVIPSVAPAPSELDILRRYVAAGGVLILMDDFGFGNAVLAHLGIGARFSGQALIEPLFNFKNPRLPRISDFSAGVAAEGIEHVVLNHATALVETDAMWILARSSPIAFLDANGNGRRDAGETSGPFVVAAASRVGAGHLVVIADPSILLNSMLDLDHNLPFVRYLLRLAGADAQVYLSEAHLPRAPLDVAQHGLARLRAILAIPPIAFVAIGVGLAWPLVRLSRPPGR